MAASVKLSLRSALEILRRVVPSVSPAARELEAAIAKATRASTVRKQLAAPKRAKKAKRKLDASAVRALVVERALGRCEACCVLETGFRPLEWDHFRGRARAESVESCWLLCRACHRAKTDNEPSAAHWLGVFAKHCLKHGYVEERWRAESRLAFVNARGGA